MEIKHFRNVINFIRREIYGDFALPQLELFLVVAEKEGITHDELSYTLSMPQPTVSRNVQKLANKVLQKCDGRYEKVGYGLLHNCQDYVQTRKFNVILTCRGKEFVKSLKAILKE